MSCLSMLQFDLSKIVLMAVIVGLIIAGCILVIPLLIASDAASRKRRHWLAGIRVFLVVVGILMAAALVYFKVRVSRQVEFVSLQPMTVASPAHISVIEQQRTEQPDTNDGQSETNPEPVPLPDWAQDFKEDALEETLAPICVVRSGQFATIAQADAEALHTAAIMATRRVAAENSYFTGDWHAPEALVREHVVRQTHVETLERDFGTMTAPMYRVYLQMDLSNATLAPLMTSWQQSVAAHRLCLLGGVLGVAVILLGTLSMFLRPRKNATPPELPAARTT